jgi:hypothetical protein
MKMTRAEKRRRKIAKMVEMKLDGMTDVDSLKHSSFEELYYFHQAWKNRKTQPDYYGASLADMVLNQKAQQIQAHIDKQILEELNGITKQPN